MILLPGPSSSYVTFPTPHHLYKFWRCPANAFYAHPRPWCWITPTWEERSERDSQAGSPNHLRLSWNLFPWKEGMAYLEKKPVHYNDLNRTMWDHRTGTVYRKRSGFTLIRMSVTALLLTIIFGTAIFPFK